MGAARGSTTPVRSGRLRTYSHLAGARRVPSEYDIVTSRLLYYPGKGGFEVKVPLSSWYQQHQLASPLSCGDWDAFAEPRRTTYTTYTALQRRREEALDVLFESSARDGYDEHLGEGWLDVWEATAPTMRFVGHGLQMVAAYVGQMAPAGRITMACAFQAGDEVRRIHRIAARMAQLRARRRPSLGNACRLDWQTHHAWQPLRRALETLLVTYDFGEALVALNVCLKPALDSLFLSTAAELAHAARDHVWAQTLASFAEDAAWHASWTQALLDFLRAAEPRNADVIAGWASRWQRIADDSLAAAERLGPGQSPSAAEQARARLCAAVAAAGGGAP